MSLYDSDLKVLKEKKIPNMCVSKPIKLSITSILQVLYALNLL